MMFFLIFEQPFFTERKNSSVKVKCTVEWGHNPFFYINSFAEYELTEQSLFQPNWVIALFFNRNHKMPSEGRDANLRAWDGEQGLFIVKPSLDSSLKKNTAFIKKIKTGISKEGEKSLIDAIRSISLEKYINEITAALCDSLTRVSKQADIQTAVDLTSALHLRFTFNFTPFVELYFVHFITLTDQLTGRDLKDKLERTKNILKLAMEFQLSGIFRTVLDMPKDELPDYLKRLEKQQKANVLIVIPMIKEVMSLEFRKGTTLAIISSFLKRYNGTFLDDENHVFSDESKAILKTLFNSYSMMAVKTADTILASIRKNESKSHSISMKTGKIVEGISGEIEDLKATHEKFNAYCQIACPILGLDLPKLETDLNDEKSQTTVTVHQSQTSQADIIWETEESKKFYTDIPKLVDLVDESLICETASTTEKGKIIDHLLSNLDMANTYEDVNQSIIFYWKNGLNNNASKNKIYQHFKSIEDVNKFKNVARFLKVNEVWFGKCIEDIIERLDKNFRFQIHHDDFAAKEILIFSELVKFKMLPIYVTFHKIRTLILNIEINGNIDLLTLLFEGCGKVLQFDPGYSENTKEMIALLTKVKDEKKFVHSDYQAVRVFLMSLKPQVSKVIYKKPEASTEEKFLNQLIKRKLNANSIKSVSGYLQKFDWNDTKIANIILKLLSKPDEINYINIFSLAKVVEYISSSINRGIYVRIVDQVIEDMTLGLEVNDYRENRKRLSQVRYLVELANLRMISSDQMIKFLYKIITFGCENGIPQKGLTNELDKPNDYFRVKMITVIIRAMNLKKFQKKVDLITFLRLFDFYIFTKLGPIPIELDDQINHMIVDVNNMLNIKLVRSKSYEESMGNLQRAMAEQGLKREQEEKEQKQSETEDSEDDDDDDDDSDDDEQDVEDNEEDDDETGDNDIEDDEDDDADEDDEDDDSIENGEEENDEDDESFMDDQFQRDINSELDSIIKESLQNTGKLINNDKLGARLGIPVVSQPPSRTKSGFVGFTLVQKTKGGRNKEFKTMNIPETSSIAQNINERTKKAAEEKANIKRIVLKSVENQED